MLSVHRLISQCLFLVFLSATSLCSYEYNLAVCTIFKDCSPYLKEWIEFHRLVGVEHFYLYDNSSTDHPRAVLKKYIERGIVTLIEWPNRQENQWGDQIMPWVHTTQLPAYDHGCSLALKKARWLAFIDSDEFLTPLSSLKLKDLLAAHRDAPGLCLYWAVYGTSDVYDIPPGCLMLELLTKRAKLDDPINAHTKSIVRPEMYDGWSWATHACRYKKGATAYHVPQHEARVNHYINRTVKFFNEHKVKNKQKIDNVTWDEDYTQRFRQLGNDEDDHTMDRFMPALRKKMGLQAQ